MQIAELNHNQKDHHNKEISLTGVVRAAYKTPFPHFLLEDHSASLICCPNGSLPGRGAHLEITGRFVLETPENCTVELAILKESHRAYIGHPTYACDLSGCAFATQTAA